MIKFLDLKKQYHSIQADVTLAMQSVCESSAFVGGPYVEKFENEFADFIGSSHCIGVGNGTDALEIALWALQFPKNSDVLVPANSFIATSEAVSRCGHNVVFADVETDYLVSVSTLKKAITPTTRAIIIVHLYGQACDMEAICKFAEENNLQIIEDCAQAHGAMFKEKKVGNWGAIGTFSFYPGKNLGAYGDGGALTTNNFTLATLIRQYANHGRTSKYDHAFEGRNSRLDGMQAAILSVKLGHLPMWIKRRQEIASLYLDALCKTPLILPTLSEGTHVWHLFVIQTPHRDALKDYLASCDVETGIHYPIALPKLGAYAPLKKNYENFKACQADTQLLSLPMGEHLEDEEVLTVCQHIITFFKHISIKGHHAVTI